MFKNPTSREEAQAQMAEIQAEYIKSTAELIKSLWGVFFFGRQCKAVVYQAKHLSRNFGISPSMNMIKCVYFEGSYSHVDLETVANIALKFLEKKFPDIFNNTQVISFLDREMLIRKIEK